MRTFITLFIFVLLASCKDLSPIKVAPELGEAFELRVGDSVTMNNSDLTILFKDVTEDSRCPRSVTCVWAGIAKLDVEFYNQTFEFDTYDKFEYEVNSYKIKFNELTPYPEDDSKIPKRDYRASFIVTQTSE
ncbi:MAG: hypothetical protein WC967_05640 [Balneolaceae bacterium]